MVRSLAMFSDLSTDNEGTTGPGLADIDKNEAGTWNGYVLKADMNEDEIEDWEGKLEEGLQGPKSHYKSQTW